MSYSLHSLKGVIWGIILGITIGVIRGYTRSLDYGSYKVGPEVKIPFCKKALDSMLCSGARGGYM